MLVGVIDDQGYFLVQEVESFSSTLPEWQEGKLPLEQGTFLLSVPAPVNGDQLKAVTRLVSLLLDEGEPLVVFAPKSTDRPPRELLDWQRFLNGYRELAQELGPQPTEMNELLAVRTLRDAQAWEREARENPGFEELFREHMGDDFERAPWQV